MIMNPPKLKNSIIFRIHFVIYFPIIIIMIIMIMIMIKNIMSIIIIIIIVIIILNYNSYRPLITPSIIEDLS